MSNEFSYRAEMGYSHRELQKELPSAVSPYSLEKLDAHTYLLKHGKRTATLTMGQETVRKIASIRIPATHICIQFENFDSDDYDAFIARFKRYLQRGGG